MPIVSARPPDWVSTGLPSISSLRDHEAIVRSAPPKLVTVRAICFTVAGYELALPVAAVSKVTHCPPLNASHLAKAGMVHIDQEIIRVLNLHGLLAETQTALGPRGEGGAIPSQAIDEDPAAAQFLIVARTRNHTCCGLLADTPPDLLDIDQAAIRTLPGREQQSPVARLAAAVALLPPESAPRAIFLLDLDRAIALAP